MSNPFDEIAPFPARAQDATADALARNLAVVAQANWHRSLDADTAKESREATGLLVNLYGIVKLLRVLQVVAPDTADEVAQDLWEDWEAGQSIGPELARWLIEYGIDSDRVAEVASRKDAA